MKAKNKKIKLIKKTILESPPPYTEGHWEDEFEYWTNYQPVSNNGKWWITIQLEKLKNKIKSYQ
jgi:hypothetical protein